MGNFWIGQMTILDQQGDERNSSVKVVVVLDVNPTWINRKGEA
jgi:hypothetical protein